MMFPRVELERIGGDIGPVEIGPDEIDPANRTGRNRILRDPIGSLEIIHHDTKAKKLRLAFRGLDRPGYPFRNSESDFFPVSILTLLRSG